MKAYPEYKDSGIEWIGEIPEHWNKKRLKYVSLTQPSNVDKKSKENEKEVFLCNYVDVYKNEFITDDIAFMKATASDSQIEKFSLELGDVLVTKDSEDPTDIAIPALVTQNFENVVCGYHLTRIRPTKHLSGRYLFRVFQSRPFNTYFEVNAKGVTRYGLGTETFLNFEALVPPLEEQTAIANFLDHKTAQIDASIAKHRQLIELLKEHRAAIINEAVTKGLPAEARAKAGIDPDVPMKDSGVEWIGEVPAHWETWKISRAFRTISSGTTPKSGNPTYHKNGTVNWINTGDLNDGILTGCKKRITEKALEDYSTLKIYPKNSLIVAMYGATIGKVAITTFEATTNQACCVLSESPVIDTKYAFYWFIANKRHIINLSYGGGQPNISQEIIKTLKIPTPPIEEQRVILDFIEFKTTRIDQEIEATQKEINLLEEYRQSLIAEAVTGKIDVRDYPLD